MTLEIRDLRFSYREHEVLKGLTPDKMQYSYYLE